MLKEFIKLALLLIVFLTLFSITGQLNKKDKPSDPQSEGSAIDSSENSQSTSIADNEPSNPDSIAIHKTILTLFEGMAEGDSAKVSSVFHKEARLNSAFRSKGEIKLREGSLADFLEAIGTAHEEVWNEKLLTFELIQNELLAQVWTNYEFYLDDTFSHCGVNAFQMIKTEKSGWKILNLTDTRKKEGCLEVD